MLIRDDFDADFDADLDAGLDADLDAGFDDEFDAGFDADLVVRRVVPLTHDVTTLVLEPPAAWSGRYDAGQHLVVSADVAGERVERCYTITTPPTRPGTLAITVKRQPAGVLSPWLHSSLRVGDRLRARGPYGEFTTRECPRGPYLFLVAGSGITPAMSMLRALADRSSEADVAFVQSARTPADLVFRQELAALPEQGLALRSVAICEDDCAGERWAGPRGRLSVELLRWFVPDVTAREVFLCGPPAYMSAALDILDGLGVSPDRIHQESFDLDAVPDLFATPFAGSFADPFAAPFTESGPAAGVATSRIELKRSEKSVDCPADSLVLDTLLDAGVMLASSCRQGLCGTCKLTLIEGQVDMRHQGGIRPREIERGMFLPCCSRPLTDLVIDA